MSFIACLPLISVSVDNYEQKNLKSFVHLHQITVRCPSATAFSSSTFSVNLVFITLFRMSHSGSHDMLEWILSTFYFLLFQMNTSHWSDSLISFLCLPVLYHICIFSISKPCVTTTLCRGVWSILFCLLMLNAASFSLKKFKNPLK